MSHPSPAELYSLGDIAHELREVLAERGHRVDTALDADPAFRGTSKRSESSLTRDLALDAISHAAARLGVDFRPVNGEGRELRCMSLGVTRRYRVRKAKRTKDGEFRVDGNSEGAEEPEDLLGRQESWVFAYSLDGLLQVDQVFIARIFGCTEGNPGQLILGPLTMLDTQLPPSGGFAPSEDDTLEGFEDGEDEAGAL
jgi:hypothetical protein